MSSHSNLSKKFLRPMRPTEIYKKYKKTRGEQTDSLEHLPPGWRTSSSSLDLSSFPLRPHKPLNGPPSIMDPAATRLAFIFSQPEFATIDLVSDAIKAGADINTAFCEPVGGGSPFEYARNFDFSLWHSSPIFLPLIEAGTHGDLDMVRFLGNHGARLNRHSLGQFPAERYVSNPFKIVHGELAQIHEFQDFTQQQTETRLEILEAMLSLTDNDMDRVDTFLRERLDSALHFRDVGAIKILLNHGVELNGHERPFSSRTINDLPSDFLTYLLDEPRLWSTLTFAESPLFSAVRAEDMGLYLQLVANPHVKEAYSIIDHAHSGYTVLHVSVGNTDARLCHLISENPFVIHVADENGNTALHYAAYYGHVDTLLHLLYKGADANQSAWRIPPAFARPCNESQGCGWTPLHIAAYRGFSAITAALLGNGADSSKLDDQDATPLDIAMVHGQTTLAFELLGCGCPFTPTNKSAPQTLVQALSECRYELVQRLLEGGVSAPFSLKLNVQEITSVTELPTHRSALRSLQHTKEEVWREPWVPATVCPDCTESIAISLKTSRIIPLSCDEPQFCHLALLVQDATGLKPVLGEGVSIHMKPGEEPRTERLVIETDISSSFFRKTSSHIVKRVPAEWHQLLGSIERVLDKSTDSASAFAIAATWLRTCLTSHRQCNTRLQSSPPTRLIDIGDPKQRRMPKLVLSPAADEPYIALSHLWGGEGLPRTTLANLDSHLREISTDALSRTMKDAISIVRRLGFRYIWVDALCIIQDSQEDWLAEASDMGSIYRGALFTLAVADSQRHSEGIFRARKARCLRPFHIDRFKGIPYRDRAEFDGEGEFYVFPSTPVTHQGARPKGPLDTRGWTLQEQLLSPRILYYGRGELSWDCLSVSASESSPISASLLNDSNPTETWALKLLRKSIAQSADIEILKKRLADVWKQIIQNYSARKLTKITDKVIAMDGILNAVAKITNDAPLAGMWRTGLWNQLLWYKRQPDVPTQEFVAPSWSWLSSDSPVFYQNTLQAKEKGEENDFTDLQPKVSIDDVHTESAPDQVGIHGQITLTGPCFQYHLTHDDIHRPQVWKRWNKSKLKMNPGRWMLDREIDTPLDVRCMVMAEDEVAKLLVCLCIVPEDGDGSRWKRIGICHWEGLLHQVSAYCGEEPVKKSITIV